MDIEKIRTTYELLTALDQSIITKMVIYRELCDYLNDEEISDALPLVYDAYLHNEIWIDLGIFSKNVAQQYHEFDSVEQLFDEMVKNQGDME